MLYTGKGDGGTTKVLDSKERIAKSSELPEALGTLDELNSYIGLARARARSQRDSAIVVGGHTLATSAILREAQEALFIIQAEVAGGDKRLAEGSVARVSSIVDAVEQIIAPIKSFSIAGGTELSSELDVARTIARRAERRVSALAELRIRALSDESRAFMNRLSSLLFALARLANHAEGVAEENPRY